MKNKIILFLVLALFSASGFCGEDEIQVMAAARNIKEGEQIAADMLKARDVNKNDLQKDVIFGKDFNLFADNGFYARIDIPKNSQITKGALKTIEKTVVGITSGWRGYFLETDAATAAVVKANDLVDILVYSNIPKPVVFTLLQKTRVLAVEEKDGKNYLYLMVAPKDAQYLFLMEKKAEKIKAVLRNPADLKAGPIRILEADGK